MLSALALGALALLAPSQSRAQLVGVALDNPRAVYDIPTTSSLTYSAVNRVLSAHATILAIAERAAALIAARPA